MLTLQDCVDFCELSEDEIQAIAEHEHAPTIPAAQLGSRLVESQSGARCIERFIREDIAQAELDHAARKATHLRRVLRQFSATHR